MSTAICSTSRMVHPAIAHASSMEGHQQFGVCPPPFVEPLDLPATGTDDADPDHVGGRLDGEQCHEGTPQGASAAVNPLQRLDHPPSTELIQIAR